MLHIRLMFIGIKTGWAPVKKCLGAQLAPGEKMFKLCPCTQLKNIIIIKLSLILVQTFQCPFRIVFSVQYLSFLYYNLLGKYFILKKYRKA
jgi:hypothetical protein